MAASSQPKISAEDEKDLHTTFEELMGAKEKAGTWPGPSFGTYTEQSTWHDEILAICRDTGLESLAAETGLIQSGEVPGVKNYNLQRIQVSTLPAIPPMPPIPPPAPPPAAADLPPPARVSGGSSMSAVELAQALLAPSTPSTAPSPWSTDITPSSSRRRKRKVDSLNGTPSSPSTGGRNKGLRHFSSRVCEKVEQKRSTTYNEVADELVYELQNVPFSEKGPLDQKNIRRRVYDALNVLMAMGIIAKERKEIRWQGLPNSKSPAQQEFEKLEKDKTERAAALKRKHEMLTELQSQCVNYRSLSARNAKMEQVVFVDPAARILVPFLLIRTRSHCVINCEVDESRTEYFLNFTTPFEIQDDSVVLTHLGLCGDTSVPTLEQYATQLLSESLNAPPAAAGSALAAAPASAAALSGASATTGGSGSGSGSAASAVVPAAPAQPKK